MLSILIPSLINRAELRAKMLASIGEHDGLIIHQCIDNGESSTGNKRNFLLSLVKTKYCWFVDDDDILFTGAVEKILKACKENSDMIGINGIMTTNGTDRIEWEIRKNHPYDKAERNGKPYYRRHANHITPMKSEIAKQIRFEDKSYGEDYEWACKLKETGLIKTETVVEDPVYHYQFITKK